MSRSSRMVKNLVIKIKKDWKRIICVVLMSWFIRDDCIRIDIAYRDLFLCASVFYAWGQEFVQVWDYDKCAFLHTYSTISELGSICFPQVFFWIWFVCSFVQVLCHFRGFIELWAKKEKSRAAGAKPKKVIKVWAEEMINRHL